MLCSLEHEQYCMLPSVFHSSFPCKQCGLFITFETSRFCGTSNLSLNIDLCFLYLDTTTRSQHLTICHSYLVCLTFQTIIFLTDFFYQNCTARLVNCVISCQGFDSLSGLSHQYLPLLFHYIFAHFINCNFKYG